MDAKAFKQVLATVTTENMTNGTMSELWAELPDMVSGADWVGEVVDCAWKIAEYIYDSEEVTEDQISDWAWQFAESEIEDYYSNINKRVQTLSLWAYSELDDEVAEMRHGKEGCSLTDLNSDYLYCAMRGLFDCVARWAVAQVEELANA